MAICLLAGWFVLDYFVLDVDRYRPMIVKAIEEASGLPASLESIDLVLLPRPHLSANKWSLGEGDFKVTLEHGEIHAQVMPLFRRELVIETIVLDGLAITAPEGIADLHERVVTVVEKLNAADKGGGEPAITIAEIQTIRAEEAKVYVSENESPVAVLTAEVSDSVSNRITVSVESTLPQYGDPARFESTVVIEQDPGTKKLTSISGTGKLDALQLAQALPVEGAPEAVLRLDLDAKGVDQDDITVRLDGVLTSENPALDGVFSTAIRWKDGMLAVNGLSWEAPGVTLAASATRDAKGVVGLSVRDLSVEEGALDTLLEMARYGELRLAAQNEALLRATDVEVALGSNWYPNFYSGVIRIEGLDAELNTGEAVSGGIHAEVEFDEGAFVVKTFSGEGFSLTGSVERNAEVGSVAVDVRGYAELNPARLSVFTSTEEMTDIGGTVHVDALKATFTEEPVVPQDLEVGIRLTEGLLGLDTSGYTDLLEELSAEIVGDGKTIATVARGWSQQMGVIEIAGDYGVETYDWDGTIAGDLGQIVSAFLPETERVRLGSVLAQYGDSVVTADIALPSPERDTLVIVLEREGEPSIGGTVGFDAGGGKGLVLGDIDASATLDAGKLDEALIGNLIASGPASIEFERSQVAETFSARFDFVDSVIEVGEYVQKRAGDLFSIDVSGKASADAWVAQTVVFGCLGETLAMDVGGDRVRVDDLAVDLAALSPLLQEEHAAHGALRGTMVFGPLEAELQFENAGFSLKPDVGIDSIDGGVTLGEDTVAFHNVELRGPQTDCRLNLERVNGEWDGTLSGEKLDLNPIMAVVEEVQALTVDGALDEGVEQEQGVDAPSDTGVPLLGTFAIELSELYYRRGRIDALRLNVSADADGIRYSEISLHPTSGSVSGGVYVPAATNDSGLMSINLAVSEVDTRDIDALLYEEPSKYEGIVSGQIDFRAPMTDGTIVMSGANGVVEWDSLDGTLGQLGLATKLLTVLKTTQIIMLKAPSLRDEGLTYDTWVGRLTFDGGVMQVEDTKLQSTSYAMVMGGEVDFTVEDTDITIFVQVLESIGGVMKKIPVVGRLTEVTTDHIGVRVGVSGSPYEPVFKVTSASSIVENVTELGKGVVGAGVGVLKGVKKVTTGTVKKVIKKD